MPSASAICDQLIDPFSAGFTLQPGEAMGDDHPMLKALLTPSETFVTPALIATFQFGVPFPANDFDIDFLAQIGSQIAKTNTVVELADLGGSDFWVPVSATRTTCESSPVQWSDTAPACVSPLGPASLQPYGFNDGFGPPHIAYRSNMPQIGNWAFGFKIISPTFSPSYILAIDLAQGAFPLGPCTLNLGLTPNLILLGGDINNFIVTHNVPVPNNAALVGVTIYSQAVLLFAQFQMTNAIAVTLGDVAP